VSLNKDSSINETKEPYKSLVQRWLQAKSTERDEAFSERVIRIAVLITILFTLISFGSVFVIGYEWGIISFPTMHFLTIPLCLLAAVSVSRNHLTMAGLLIASTVLFGANGVILLTGEITIGMLYGIPAALFVPIFSTLALARFWILPVCLVSALTVSLSLYTALQENPVAGLENLTFIQQFTNTSIIFLFDLNFPNPTVSNSSFPS